MAHVTFRLVSPKGNGVIDAMLLAAYPNGTYRTGRTDENGECALDLYRTDQPMLVLGAAERHLALRETVVPGEESTVTLPMAVSVNGRQSILFTKSTGYIPGVEGRLNPVNDGGRLYVYADNIAVNGHVANPVHFEIGEPLHFIDAYGIETEVSFIEVTAQFSLIEYTEPRPYGEPR